ncbi:ATP-dependent RNA helicase A-like [Tribolium madens]|uniref:ATP-dependent RNA helicase A-like n=1 Tax=Tribolium madens TaxID=41895 RepID=UPI001CF75AA8|nr:ATP-dependent RNA helicase A-like [Tribolium madens]
MVHKLSIIVAFVAIFFLSCSAVPIDEKQQEIQLQPQAIPAEKRLDTPETQPIDKNESDLGPPAEEKSDLDTANTFWGWGGGYYRRPSYWGGYGGYGGGWRRGYGWGGYGRGFGGWGGYGGGWGWGGNRYYWG